MKLYCSKILLISLPLNILLTSYHAHNKNKIYITPHHTPICTLRVLSECDIQSSNYDKDADIKSVKEIFDRQSSQRFEEYQERMKDKRQKSKEQREKNIQKIIEKDKMDKSLAEKIEKVCLRCGCGLGGVAASVGIFGTVAVNELTKAAITAAAEEALKDAALVAAATAKGAAAFKSSVFVGIKTEFGVSIQGVQRFESLFTASTYPNASKIAHAINFQYKTSSCLTGGSGTDHSVCTWVKEKFFAAQEIQGMTQGRALSTNTLVETHVNEIVKTATTHAAQVTKTATDDAIKASTLAAESIYSGSQTAIIASVVAIIIIALVMIIIYLVLRYRRKKKMKKKAEYTELLNQ
ncbi:rifin PIR protein, putative [Plasmodium reichenowi]|uniref:Rifin PIR protein, putative n=1 Tax=Plasmodium reichenowi TaxID=5854 RepID=A0A2P9D6H8_PLARE|nr:rifin PIR protein, putative [Plasmodium reichenowi]